LLRCFSETELQRITNQHQTRNKSGAHFRVRISGELACFTRPEFSTERFSYETITPSAARGILEAILWKPGMRWEISRISVLNQVRWVEFRRNEVNQRVPTKAAGTAARKGKPLRDFYANEDRAQRNTVALRDVDYLVEARILMTAKAGPEDNLAKFCEMFDRRLAKGQQVFQPYLGCREFPAKVVLAAEAPKPIQESRDLGWMLHDLEYGRERSPRFFRAQLKNGVIVVPEWKRAVRR